MLVRDLSRRSFLHGLTGGSLAAFTTPGLFAQQLVDTGTTTVPREWLVPLSPSSPGRARPGMSTRSARH